MLRVETRRAVHPEHAKGMDTGALRAHFLAGGLFAEGEIRLVYTHYDRFTLGGAVPGGGVLTLDHVEETKTPSFLDRREMGIVNIGGTGTVSAAGESWTLDNGDVLYLGSMLIMAYNVYMTVRGSKVSRAIVPPPAAGVAIAA